ncbi:uncharacterized protein [Arachis hypogaea]|uniref:uncharacterized protein isoform X1 n=2 Tax=Arachis hypogaea TaxID=3818 RepID=UPI000DECE604|nr:protein FAM91A1 isoform X1 [Arachis hypogaea]
MAGEMVELLLINGGTGKMRRAEVTVEELLVDRAVKEECTYENLPKRLQATVSSKDEWHKRIVQHCIKKRLQWSSCYARKVSKENEYYDEMIPYLRKHLALFPYHLSEYVCRVMRVSAFRYYCDMLFEVMKNEQPYDSIPNFSAADALRLTGIGRNEFIDIMNKCRSKKIMWKINKSIAREHLPTQPVDFPIEPWWGVCLVNFTLDEFKKLSEDEMATIDKVCKEEANSFVMFDAAVVRALSKRGLVYFDIPVYPDDRLKVSRLEGFVSNREQSFEDPIEDLVYAVFVVSNENATVSELATTLQADLSHLQAAAAFMCRLGWATKAMDPQPVVLDTSIPGSPKSVSGDEDAFSACLGSENQLVDGESIQGDTPRSKNHGHRSSYTRVAFMVDANITSYLMMGSVSPGLKSHAVTLYEAGKLGHASIDDLCKDLSTIEGVTFEGELQEFADHASSLRCVLECLQSGGVLTTVAKEEEEIDKTSVVTSSNDEAKEEEGNGKTSAVTSSNDEAKEEEGNGKTSVVTSSNDKAKEEEGIGKTSAVTSSNDEAEEEEGIGKTREVTSSNDEAEEEEGIGKTREVTSSNDEAEEEEGIGNMNMVTSSNDEAKEDEGIGNMSMVTSSNDESSSVITAVSSAEKSENSRISEADINNDNLLDSEEHEETSISSEPVPSSMKDETHHSPSEDDSGHIHKASKSDTHIPVVENPLILGIEKLKKRKKYRVDILRSESLASLAPATLNRLFIHDYDIVVSIVPLPSSSILPKPTGPIHFGPPAYSSMTPWMKLVLYSTIARGPLSVVLMKGQCLSLLPAPLAGCEKALIWSWDGSAIGGLGKKVEGNLVKGSILLHCLNSLLRYSAVLVLPLSRADLSKSGNVITLDIPLPLKNSDGTVASVGKELGLSEEENSKLKPLLTELAKTAELSSVGYIRLLRLFSGRESNKLSSGTYDWVPLSVEFGIPLFSPKLCSNICKRIASSGLLQCDSFSEHHDAMVSLRKKLRDVCADYQSTGSAAKLLYHKEQPRDFSGPITNYASGRWNSFRDAASPISGTSTPQQRVKLANRQRFQTGVLCFDGSNIRSYALAPAYETSTRTIAEMQHTDTTNTEPEENDSKEATLPGVNIIFDGSELHPFEICACLQARQPVSLIIEAATASASTTIK